MVLLLMCLALAGIQGCAFPQDVEDHFVESYGRPVVRATRYAGREANLVHNLWIKLEVAPTIQFRFPSGQWINVREITQQTLVEQGIRIDKHDDYSMASWHPDLPVVASVVGRHQYFSFRIENDGMVSDLVLGACGSAFEEVLRTMDGVTFGFPMRVKDVERLFGPVSRVDRTAIVTGFSCF
jgi:hypothetical protein